MLFVLSVFQVLHISDVADHSDQAILQPMQLIDPPHSWGRKCPCSTGALAIVSEVI